VVLPFGYTITVRILKAGFSIILGILNVERAKYTKVSLALKGAIKVSPYVAYITLLNVILSYFPFIRP
jgi:hypothetical protein